MQTESPFRSWRLLGIRLLIAYLGWTLTRLAFLMFNLKAFDAFSVFEIAQSFVVGLLFDTVPLFYYNLLFILLYILPNPWKNTKVYKNIGTGVFFLTNSVGMIQNLIDTGYFDFSKKRTGAEILIISKEFEGHTMDYITDYWYLSLVLIAILFILWKLYLKTQKYEPFTIPWHSKIVYQLGILLATVGIVIIALRGGFFRIPLRTFDAAKMVPVGLVQLTINTPFQFICTVEDEGVPELRFFDDSTAQKIANPIKDYSNSTTPFRPDNVVVIILESFGKEYMGYFNEGKGYTPFLDSLCKNSLMIDNSYASGSISMDAPPAILSSLPKLVDESYITSRYNTNTITSIGSLLHEKGYTNSFYHGGHNGTMGFDSYVGISQSGKYFGLNEYPDKKDFDGSWGIADEPYFQYFADELTKTPQPFYSAIFSLSSHHPYYVPEKYQEALPKGTLAIHQSIGYTDLSLKEFFKKAQKLHWFKNTLFVITADHTSDSETPFYQTSDGKFRVPIILYKGDGSLKGEITKTVQQFDIMPTVLDYLHYDKPFFAMGNSAFEKKDGYAIMYTNGIYQIISYPYQLQLNHEGQVISYFNIKENKETERDSTAKKLEDYLKASLQIYTKGLIENKLHVEIK